MRDNVTHEPHLPFNVRFFTRDTCHSAEFHKALSDGLPICIANCDAGLQGDWVPQAFIRKYGDMEAAVSNCSTGELAPGVRNAGTFFGILDRHDTVQGLLRLKVRIMGSLDAHLTLEQGLASGKFLQTCRSISEQRFQ